MDDATIVTDEPSLSPTAGPVRTTRGQPTDELDTDRQRPTAAEQAVPWLIGVVLLLSGIVIVLLALIFTGDDSFSFPGAGGSTTPRPTDRVIGIGSPSPSPSPTPAPEATPMATATPGPQYGPLEMVYAGRAAALAPIYLLRHDFTTEDEPVVLAQDPNQDVHRFAWAPDGRRGAAIIAGRLVSIEPNVAKRALADDIVAATFGLDSDTVYAVRVTAAGGNDTAEVLEIGYESEEVRVIASYTYPRPATEEEDALREAQFVDDGGPYRLFFARDEMLRLWILGGPVRHVDPADGSDSELGEEDLPALWSPGASQHVEIADDGSTTTLTLRNEANAAVASTTVDGLVSHLRWAPDGRQVVFTLGRSTSGGGVLQDLFLWDLTDGEPPVQLTNTGAAFGGEWLGSQAVWRP